MDDKVNILIVGSEVADIEALSSILKPLKENIITCIGIQKAVDYIESYEFALIILDKSLISNEGIELITIIRRNEKSHSTPILILGGELMDEEFSLNINEFHGIDVLPATVAHSILYSRASAYAEIMRHQKHLKEKLISLEKQDNILVLNNDPDILLVFQQIAKPENIAVLGANNEKAAYELLSKFAVSVLFISTRLPNFDVAKFCRSLKSNEKYQHIQIIILSDIYSVNEDSLIACEIGAVDIIAMPSPPEILKTKMILYLTHGRDLRALAEKLIEIQKLNEELTHSRSELKQLNLTLQERINEKTTLLQKAAEELRRQNEQLILSGERFRLIVEGTDLGIFLTNPEDNIVFFNTRFAQMIDSSSELIDNKNPAELFGENNRDALIQLLNERSKNAFPRKEIKFTRKDGASLWYSITVSSIYDKNDNFYGHCGILADITGRKLYEEKIKQQAELLDSASDAILLTDLEGVIRYCNKSTEKIIGVNPVDCVGKNLVESFHIISKTEFNSILDRLSKSGEYDKELTRLSPDGKEITIHSRWKLLLRQEESAIMITATDISEKKEYEKQLYHAARLESIGAIASGMAHDLNNILAPIVMSASMLLEEEQDPTRKKLLDAIEKAQHAARMLLNRCLHLPKNCPAIK